MHTPSKLLFLPGASGNTEFWKPVAALLDQSASHVHFGWPGFGATACEPCVNGIEDLVEKVISELDQPTAIVAQSMGGVIALLAAHRRPSLVTHLVLSVTSGGVDIRDLAAQDWRPAFAEANPTFPRWFIELRLDLTAVLPSIATPSLLLWGDADPISPVAVGERLAALLPQSRLHVLPGGDHDLGSSRASEIAPLIAAHFAAGRTACSAERLPAALTEACSSGPWFAHPSPGGPTVSEHNKLRIAEFLDRVLSRGDISAAGEYFHEDMVEEVPFPGQGPGLEGLKHTLTALRTAFPDMRWHVEEQIAQDSRVLTRFVWEGTQHGDFLGIPPSHRAVRVWGMVIDQFEGSKVKSTRLLMDTLGLMQQLGALPASPA